MAWFAAAHPAAANPHCTSKTQCSEFSISQCPRQVRELFHMHRLAAEVVAPLDHRRS